MKKKLILLFIILILSISVIATTVTAGVSTRNSGKVGHSYIALSEGLGLGSIRFGRRNFELGLYPGYLLGVGGIVNMNNLYATFATGLINADIGVYAGVGVEFYNFWICNVRFEVAGVSSYHNYTSGHALIGLNFGI
ncbi:MAG: hypothetical protein HQK51_07660 [Oligoflexia bacterium]|nr:hypothetical protein [Oligoflexia bacterium]